MSRRRRRVEMLKSESKQHHAHRTTTLMPSTLTYSSRRWRLCPIVISAHDGGTVGAKPLTNPRCFWTTTPHLLTPEAPVATRKGPKSANLLRKYTLNGRVTEAMTASGPDTKVGVKFLTPSRPPYDCPTALKRHVEQPTLAAVLGSNLGA